DVDLEEVGAPEVVARLLGVDAHDLGHVGLVVQALDGERAPPARDPGDQDPAIGHSPIVVAGQAGALLRVGVTARTGWSGGGWRSMYSQTYTMTAAGEKLGGGETAHCRQWARCAALPGAARRQWARSEWGWGIRSA